MRSAAPRKLTFERLEQRQLLSASPLANATSVTLASNGSGSLNGTLIRPGNAFAYRFTAPLSGMLVMREIPTGSSLFPAALSAFNSAQQPISSIYANPPGSLSSRVVINATKGSVYYALAAASQGTVGTYQMQWVMDDVGDTPALASSISLITSGGVNLIGSATQNGTVNYAGDVDVFKFTSVVPGGGAGTAGFTTIRLSAQNSSVKTLVDVYDSNYLSNPNEAPLVENSAIAAGTPYSQVEVPVVSGSVYYVKASGSLNSVGAYQLQLSTIKDDGLPHSFATADAAWLTKPVLIGVQPTPLNTTIGPLTVTGPGTTPPAGDPANPPGVYGNIAYPGQADYLRFVAPVSGTMTIRQIADTNQNSSLDSYLYIYDANHNLIVSSNVTGGTVNSRAQFNIQAGATYYLKASGFGNSTGAYQLLFYTNCTVADDFPEVPPFSITNQAASLTLDAASGAVDAVTDPATGLTTSVTVGAPGAIDYLGDVDWFSFISPSAGAIAVQETALSGSLSGQVSAYTLDASGNPTNLVSGNNPGAIAKFNVDAGTTYYLKVAATSQTAGQYVIQTSIGPPAPPPSTISVVGTTTGITSAQNAGITPPDTNAAAGPTAVVETVNTSILMVSKTGTTLVPNQQFSQFFASIYNAGDSFTDPEVVYDEGAGRFYVAVLEGPANLSSYADLDFAVSKTSDPTQGFYFTKITSVNFGQADFPDYEKLGYNADAVFISTINYGAVSQAFKYNAILTIAKNANFLGGMPISTWQTSQTMVPFTLANQDISFLLPARMHGDSGGTEYFVQMLNDTTINVVAATNYLTSIQLTPTSIMVAPFTTGTPYPGDIPPDTRMLSADWRGNMLVAAQNVGVGGKNVARWYEFSTAGTAPALVQQGNVSAAASLTTTYPSVALGLNGQIAMTFIAQSATFPMTMEITGWQSTDPLGTMEAATVVAAGVGTGTTAGKREGDYSSVVFDPTDGSFWAANEYQRLPTGNSDDWGTALVNFKFNISPSAAVAKNVLAPVAAPQNNNTSQAVAIEALIKYLTTKK